MLQSAKNFNPRSPHGERLAVRVNKTRKTMISIHAPRTGSDGIGQVAFAYCSFQSTLPARGATRHCYIIKVSSQFQSTLPARGATVGTGISSPDRLISIHAPRTGSDGDTSQPRRLGSISIHAPRTGSDHYLRSGRLYASRFQTTLPARGATPVLSGRVPFLIYFNPRSPHG